MQPIPASSAPTGAPAAPVPFYKQLYVQVVVAIAIGILLGYFEPQYGVALKPLGTPSSSW